MLYHGLSACLQGQDERPRLFEELMSYLVIARQDNVCFRDHLPQEPRHRVDVGGLGGEAQQVNLTSGSDNDNHDDFGKKPREVTCAGC